MSKVRVPTYRKYLETTVDLLFPQSVWLIPVSQVHLAGDRYPHPLIDRVPSSVAASCRRFSGRIYSQERASIHLQPRTQISEQNYLNCNAHLGVRPWFRFDGGQSKSYEFFERISLGRQFRKTTADPSTPLRFAQDDTIWWGD